MAGDGLSYGASTMNDLLSIGVDIGGTKIEAVVLGRPAGSALGSGQYQILARRRVATERERGYEAVLETTAQCIRATAGDAGISPATTPIGVGMPGSITRREGLVKNANTVCLNGKPFRSDLERLIGRAIRFENDANCFALAEAVLGAGCEHVQGIVFGVIMGTGVGGGIVIGGKVWAGPQNIAGEWGHHAVGPWWRRSLRDVPTAARKPLGVEAGREPHDTAGRTSTEHSGPREEALGLGERPVCYCGNTGCLELYASGVAVENDYRRRTGKSKELSEIVIRRESDSAAAESLDEMLEAFGRGVANVVDILDPSAVVLGGGASNLDILYTEGVARVARYVFNDELLTPILKHKLGDSAGVIGAALLDGV